MQGCLQSGSKRSSPVRVIFYRLRRQVRLHHGYPALTSLRVLAILQCNRVSQARHAAICRCKTATQRQARWDQYASRGQHASRAEHASWRSARGGKRSEEVRSMPGRPHARCQEALQSACTTRRACPTRPEASQWCAKWRMQLDGGRACCQEAPDRSCQACRQSFRRSGIS